MVAISETPPTIKYLQGRKDRYINSLGKVTETLEKNGTNLFTKNPIDPESPTPLEDLLARGKKRRRAVENIIEYDVPKHIGDQILDIDRKIVEIAQPLVEGLKSLAEQGHLNPDEVRMYEALAATLPKVPEPPPPVPAAPKASELPAIPESTARTLDPQVEKFLAGHPLEGDNYRPKHILQSLGLRETKIPLDMVYETLNKQGFNTNSAVIKLTADQVRVAADAIIHQGIHGIDMDYARDWLAKHPKMLYSASDLGKAAGRETHQASMTSKIRSVAMELGIELPKKGGIPAEIAPNIISRLRPFNEAHSQSMKGKGADHFKGIHTKQQEAPAAPAVVNIGPTSMRVPEIAPSPVPPTVEPIQTPESNGSHPSGLRFKTIPAAESDAHQHSPNGSSPDTSPVPATPILEAPAAPAIPEPTPPAPLIQTEVPASQPAHNLSNAEVHEALAEIRGRRAADTTTATRDETSRDKIVEELTENEAKLAAFLKDASDPLTEAKLLNAFGTKISTVVRNSMLRAALEGLRKKRPGNIKTERDGRVSWFDPKATEDSQIEMQKPPETPALEQVTPDAILPTDPTFAEVFQSAPRTDVDQPSADLKPETDVQISDLTDGAEVEVDLNGNSAIPEIPTADTQPEITEIPQKLNPDATDLFSFAFYVRASMDELKKQGFIFDEFSMGTLGALVGKNFADAKPAEDPKVSVRAGVAKIRQIMEDPQLTQLFRDQGADHQALVSVIKGGTGKSTHEFFLALDGLLEEKKADEETAKDAGKDKLAAKEGNPVWEDDDLYALAVLLKTNATRKLKADFGMTVNPPDNVRLDRIMSGVKSRYQDEKKALPDLGECYDIADIRLAQLAEIGLDETMRLNEGADARWIFMRFLSSLKSRQEVQRFKKELQGYHPVPTTV